MQTQGTVTINGARVPATTTIFEGDRIQTSADSVATISAQGVMAQLDPNTSAIFSSRALDLGCGSALLTTSVGTMVRVAGVTITPAANGTTKLKIAQEPGTLRVTAVENWALVHDGQTIHMLSPGQSWTMSRPSASCALFAQTPQTALRVYLPAGAVVGGAGVLGYCSTHGFCSQASPAVP